MPRKMDLEKKNLKMNTWSFKTKLPKEALEGFVEKPVIPRLTYGICQIRKKKFRGNIKQLYNTWMYSNKPL